MNLYGIEIEVFRGCLKTISYSNWTFMELKFFSARGLDLGKYNSNWTFMELKSLIKRVNLLSVIILIEPLWNWNFAFCKFRLPSLIDSNWTFMELKYKLGHIKFVKPNILIEPLWNWNDGVTPEYNEFIPILIEPLWNWNSPWNALAVNAAQDSNWTFMELK